MWYTGLVAEEYKRKPNTKCSNCNIKIYRRPCQIGKGRVFCSSICYGLANRNETPCVVCGKPIMAQLHKKTCSRGCANTNRVGMKYHLNSPKDNAKTFRLIKLRLMDIKGGKCEKCMYNKAEILQIHHKDRNRKNNDLSNLELICPNCHYEEHLLEKSWLNI